MIGDRQPIGESMEYEVHSLDDDIAAHHLLDIRTSIYQEVSNFHANLLSKSVIESATANSTINKDTTSVLGSDDEKASMASLSGQYSSKFYEIYKTYQSDTNVVNIRMNLMSLALDHLTPFACWARDSISRNQWIRTILDDNRDLRPEVRNGLALILIYSFAAAKAALFGTDIFSILQDQIHGLGIINKTSIKIYNDPHDYFSFLKACITGLIEAGAMPENERINQVRYLNRRFYISITIIIFL